MTFERFGTVVVPFPFTDRKARLRRPALVLSDKSFGAETGQSLLAMITRAQRSAWPNDVVIRDFKEAGLVRSCVIRLKLFTLADTLIVRRLGHLSGRDAHALRQALAHHLGLEDRAGNAD